MKFLAMMIALAASTASVTAAPLSTGDAHLATEENKLEARSCPNGWEICGTCNGTSCKIGGFNWDCTIGSCTVQSGGGDGKLCGGTWTSTTCPGK